MQIQRDKQRDKERDKGTSKQTTIDPVTHSTYSVWGDYMTHVEEGDRNTNSIYTMPENQTVRQTDTERHR